MTYYIIQEGETRTLTSEDPCNLAIEYFDDRYIARTSFEEMKNEDIFGEFFYDDRLL